MNFSKMFQTFVQFLPTTIDNKECHWLYFTSYLKNNMIIKTFDVTVKNSQFLELKDYVWPDF